MAKRQYIHPIADSETQGGKTNSNLRQVAPAGTMMPTVEIPQDDQIKPSYGWGETWKVSTSEGPISVAFAEWRFKCRGSLEALVARGLMSPEWAPGRPGNNSTNQTIEFNADGAFLFLGKQQRRRSTTATRLLIVRERTKGTYTIWIPTTKEQVALMKDSRQRMQVAAAQEQCDEPEDLVEQEPSEETKPSQRQMLDPHDPDDLCVINARLIGVANCAIDDVARLLDPFGGALFSEASEARILRLINELRTAFAEGNLVPELPALEQRGNIIAWPGRGRVCAVSLS